MRRLLLILAVLAVVGIGLSALLRPEITLADLQPGDPAPAFSLVDEMGKTVHLADYKGKFVVLEWTNPDCPFVKRHGEEGTMVRLAGKFSPSDVYWFAVNSSRHATTEGNIAWKETAKLSYPILDDKSGKVGKAYGAKTTPHIFIIDREQKIAYSGAIDSDAYGDDESRTAYVEDALLQLTSGNPVKTAKTDPYGCSVKYAS